MFNYDDRGEVIIKSIYSRLLKLYRKNKDSGKIPLEDYTTEILVDLLRKNKDILSHFVTEILEIQEENFQIESQKKYYLEDDINCIADIVLKNEKNICFIENKVNSKEGERQLERYAKVLNNIFKEEKKNVYLRCCTKYYDKKEINTLDFKQFRWMDVYNFLKQYEEREIVKEFLEFIRSEEMSSAGEFDFQDMIILSNFNYTISKINECFDNIIDIMEEHFQNLNRTSTIKQINDSNGFWLWKENILGIGYSEVYLGISVLAIQGKSVPRLMAGINIKKNNSQFDQFKKYLEDENVIFEKFYIGEDKIDVWFEESFSKFIPNENQLDEIQDWFFEKLKKVNDFKKKSNKLNWL